MNKRKIIIGIVTFAGMVFLFGVYNLLVKTPEIILDNETADDERIVAPNFDEEAGEIGGTKIATVGNSVFITRDEKTKRIKRIFGFRRLLNPSEGGNLWRLQEPYMKVMDDKFKFDIRSKRGKVRVEKILGEVTPKMAELNDEVVIQMHMLEDNKDIEIFLDDLIYDNEMCSFSSEGPVKLVSADGIMEGTGMLMIYDGELGKLAHLEIMNLDYLILKNVAKDDPAEKDAPAKPQTHIAAVNPDTAAPVVGPVVEPGVTPDKPAVNKDDAKPVAEDEKYKYYQCRLLDNVNIDYRKRLVIVGADEVTISNILWSDDKDDKSATDKTATDKSAQAPAAAKAADPASQENIAAPGDLENKTKEDVSGTRDVYVTCNGSLIIRPMELIDTPLRRLSINNRRMMEFTGTPLRVGQVLDLATNDTKRFVELTMTENRANIYTQASNMKFDGTMNIFFAGRSNEKIAQKLSLSTVNLVGGMLANINKDGKNVPVKMTGSGDVVLEPKEMAGERPTRFRAKKIDYDMLSGTAVATGDVEFMFYAPEKDDPDNSQKTDPAKKLPVVITAQKNARFFPAENQVIFNGSVVGKKRTDKPGFVQYDAFYGDRLIVDIAKSQDSGKDEIKHVRVVGGLVELRSKRTVGDVVTNYTGLACLQIDYDAVTGVIIAKGDGGDASEILINNENAPEPEPKKNKSDGSSLDIGGPCVASISGFKTLTWNTAATESKTFADDSIWWDNLQVGIIIISGQPLPWLMPDVPEKETIIVDGEDGQINMGYMSFKDGKRGQVVHASTKHLTGRFSESIDGKLDIVWLKAKDGIFYEEVGLHKMMGDSMLYTGTDGIMVIRAAEGEDCIVDGARMPQIEYNMKTGKIKSKLSSRPGIIQMNR